MKGNSNLFLHKINKSGIFCCYHINFSYHPFFCSFYFVFPVPVLSCALTQVFFSVFTFLLHFSLMLYLFTHTFSDDIYKYSKFTLLSLTHSYFWHISWIISRKIKYYSSHLKVHLFFYSVCLIFLYFLISITRTSALHP